MRRVISISLSTIVAAAALAYLCTALPQAVTDPQDFRAFYCAGAVFAAGQDPYLAAPLGRCEDRLIEGQGATPLAGLVVPAPLPGYVLPAFVVLAKLPFRLALGMFSVGILFAYVASGIVLVKIARCPPWAVAASIGLCGALVSLTNGQIAPFAFLAVCLAAFEHERGNDRRAALYALGAAIEPHIGIPVLLSLFFAAPRSRIVLAAGSGMLVSLAAITLGTARCLEYLTRVLPEQTRSEIHSSDQYGLTALLHAVGVSDGTALAVGDAQYAITVVLAVALARRVAAATRVDAIVVTLPAAFALVGGPYIHLVQMVFAVPLLLSLTTSEKVRIPAAIALLLIAVPWRDVVLNAAPFAAVSIVLATTAITLAFISKKTSVALLACVAMLAVGAAERALLEHHEPVRWDASQAAAMRGPGVLAEEPWRAYEDHVGAYETAGVYLAANAPTWLGLLLAAACATYSARSASRTAPKLRTSAARAPG